MKYTKEERIDIGRQVYTQELTHKEAEKKYGIVKSGIDHYIQDYKIANGIPIERKSDGHVSPVPGNKATQPFDIEAYKAIEHKILRKLKEVEMLPGTTMEKLITMHSYHHLPI